MARRTTSAPSEPLWLHEIVTPLPFDHAGPFVRTPRGQILTVAGQEVYTSRGQGKAWQARPLDYPMREAKAFRVSNERALLCTSAGSVIVAFMNLNERQWLWRSELGDALPGTRLPLYAMRSTDGGRTWDDPVMLHEAWTGDVRDMIQTRSGRIVISTQRLIHQPGRHGVITYGSDDDGRTWTASNLIDLGGQGHHGGIFEAAITELADGRLWMLMRTNWGRFWSAYSDDQGRSWRQIHASEITASSAPAILKRLASGRLALCYNQLAAEGQRRYPTRGGDGQWSDVETSMHRGELSLRFSDDEGQTFSPPLVIARQKGAWLSYPRIFEPKPGLLWITTMQGGLRLSLRERDALA